MTALLMVPAASFAQVKVIISGGFSPAFANSHSAATSCARRKRRRSAGASCISGGKTLPSRP